MTAKVKPCNLLFAIRSAVLCGLMLCFLASCDKPPVDAIINAEKTLQQARDGKAGLYAAAQYEKADKALKEARNLVKARKYKEAAESAGLATRYARQSIDLVPSGRERYVDGSKVMLDRMKTQLDVLENGLNETKNKRKKKTMEDTYRPFIEKWGIEIKSLEARLEKEEPYDTYNIIEKDVKLFEEELKGLKTSSNKNKRRP